MSAEIIRINREHPESSLINYAAEQVRKGHVLGMPTDTFYGLAADPYNLRAVERIYQIKGRAKHKPLSLLVENVEMAEDLARLLPDEFYELTRKYWPGPLTVIVRAGTRVPLKVTASTGNVAIRVPAATVPLAVIKAAGVPVTATSANLSGAPECTSAEAVRDQLGARLSIIVDGGPSPRSVASTIVDLSHEDGSWHIQREGAIPAEEINKILSRG